MWLYISIFIVLIVLALLLSLYTAQREKPIAADERYMMVIEDGLLELCGGLFLILAGAMFTVNPALIAIFAPLLYVTLLSAKTAVTKPRLDLADLPAEVAGRRQLKMLMLLGLAVLVGMVAFLFFVVDIAALRGWLTLYLTPTLVFVIAASLTLWAYRTGIGRLSLYAALILAIYTSSFWLPITFPIYLIAIGSGMILVGARETVRFVQEHPKLSANA
ncbi:MAG: hypothetical protein R2867_39180 [Caldilineaceae bacterium]